MVAYLDPGAGGGEKVGTEAQVLHTSGFMHLREITGKRMKSYL